MAAAGLALVLAGCGPEAALDRLAAGREAVAGQAVSGDLLLLAGGERLRLTGIEAPGEDEPYAQEARRALEGLAAGRRLELMFGGARQDPFGRTAAQARRTEDRLWVQAELLSQGAARVRTFSDNRALAGELLAEEARARIAGRGLWALPAYRVLLPREVGAEAEGFLIVEGRVLRATRAAGRVYLDFDRDWRGAFAAEVAPEAERAFALAELDPMMLEGRLIRIRGSVRQTRNGPRMRLDHPEQVERLAEAQGNSIP